MSTPTKTARILASELMAVRGELTRIDAKCGALVGLAGAGLAFLMQASTQRLDLAVRVLAVVAAVCWAGAALVLLVRVLRPQLGSTGFCRWADMTPGDICGEILAAREDTHASRELVFLSTLARRKYAALRTAVNLLAAGVIVVAVAALAGLAI
ncbi:Pycsar system effector family protein [Actinocorallia libanotica]|uniref:Pycsar effector protein domain-containing protein n=1 Tax=Actinocorallia libanotica TaxID=46162 RepID=A0ABP4CGI4_9ACTN